MAMEKPKLWGDFGVVNGGVNSNGDESVNGLLMHENNVEESENPENVILEDWDSYWEDINDRLTVSRMVSDSVIKGMVSAIEKAAAEKIAQKELELARVKETLHLYHVGSDESESFGSLVMQHEPGTAKHGSYSSLSDALVDYDRIGESLGSLKNAAKEQLKSLRKEIDRMRGSCSLRRIGSGSEMVGLGGILQDKVSDIKWMDVDKTLDSLRTTVDTICKKVDNMVDLSKASLCQWQQEKEFQAEIEDTVIINCIRSLKEDFEERLWDQSAQFYDNESVNWSEKIKEISSLRQELNAISRSLSIPEIGHITPCGSMEIGGEWDTNKRTDQLHRKISGNHVSLSTSIWEGNGKHDEAVIAMPENLDFSQLKHMTKDELLIYFKIEMTKMKRDHELRVQGMTEEYFSLKREYLRERDSSLPVKKDKEFDALRKKIPEVILKLEDILGENEKLPTFSKNVEGLSSLKDKLDSLLLENRRLGSLLVDKKREIKCLSSQVSDNAEIMLQHSLAEATLLKRIDKLQCALDDSHIEASINKDVYKCVLQEVVDSVTEQSEMEYKIMREVYEIIFREATHNAKPSGMYGFEDSDLESVIMQELSGVILGEALKEAEVKLNSLNLKYGNETEIRVSAEEKVNEAAAALVKEKERFESVSQELKNLRDETSQQQILISENSKEFDDLKDNFLEALEQIQLYKVEVRELKQKLELALKEFREVDEEKRVLQSVNQHIVSSFEAKEREHRSQMQSLFVLIQGLSKQVVDFECGVMEDIKESNSRLDSLSSQSRVLIQKANIIKKSELSYKQKLERRSSDLQKAEAEVDLLGDEVDALLRLLEKIYIALDHYSPILQHYPGIIEILKLVRRELSGESAKSV
ncbi:WPP domain-associated protein [Melia azedarach]|uniref:WPP domain-associated protein n=1 Tax=Melia azedarach TaxID=155640 RepID=A0ACC1WYB8_MELAZ|nr:WPP domain-associated protein [Melia azedarach]